MLNTTIANFKIEKILGAGGMGTVYKAIDLRLQRPVAVKALHQNVTTKSNAHERFMNEAKLSAQISHPNVATLFDFLDLGGRAFIIMEFVDGITIDALIDQNNKLDERKAINIVKQALEGLQAAHKLGILHRDLKPSNLILNSEGKVKLMDFGIAKSSNSKDLTAQNRIIGTAEYIAPEIYLGKKPSKRSDLYAVGIILYKMLTGKTPFDENNEARLIYRIVNEKIDFTIPGISPSIQRIINKLTSKNVTYRYASAEAVLRDLNALKYGPSNKIHWSEKVSAIPSVFKNVEIPHLVDSDKVRNILKQPAKLFFIISAILSMGLIIINLLAGMNFHQEQGGANSKILANESKVVKDQNESKPVLKEYDRSQTIERDGSYVPYEKSSSNGSFKNPIASEEVVVDDALKSKKISAPKNENKKASKDRNVNKPKSIEKVSNHHIALDEDKSESQSSSGGVEKVGGEVNESKNNPADKSNASGSSAKAEVVENEVEKSTEQVERVESKKRSKKSLTVEKQYFTVRFPDEVSSADYSLGSQVLLAAADALVINGIEVVSKNAVVRAKVVEYKKKNNGKVYFGIAINDVRTNFNQWLALDYPLYSSIKMDKVVFSANTTLNKVKLIDQSTIVYY